MRLFRGEEHKTGACKNRRQLQSAMRAHFVRAAAVNGIGLSAILCTLRLIRERP